MKDKHLKRKQLLDELVNYGYTGDISTGKIYGLKGQEIGTKEALGYIRTTMSMKNKPYYIKAHQFIYYLATGEVPEYIDHINRDKTDNRIENLRSVSNQENLFNTNAKGYYYFKKIKRWQAQIMINGKSILLGSYVNEEEAKIAYQTAKKIYHIIK